MSKKLIIPIEIKNRELQGACLLAKEFCTNGWEVYIGQKQQLFPYIKTFKKSVWYLKSIVPGEVSLLKKIKKSGNFICTLDVEGLVTDNYSKYVYTRYNEDTIKLADQIFFWNKFHYNLVKEISKKKDLNKFHITGSPIMDIWKLNTKKRKPKYILICTSFTLVNNLNGTNILNLFFDNIDKKHINSYKKYLKNYLAYYKIGFNSYLKILSEIFYKYKSKKFIIRPHPVEDIEKWKNFAKKFHNVFIDNKTDLTEQINNSSKVIHFNSTAGVQSIIQGKETLMYFPNEKKRNDLSSPIFKKNNGIIYNKKDFISLKRKTNKFSNDFFNKKKDILYSSKKIFQIINSTFTDKKNNHDPFKNLFKSYYLLLNYKFKNFVYKYLLKTKKMFSLKNDHNLSFAKDKKYYSYKWTKTTKNEIKKKIILFDEKNYLKGKLIVDQHPNGFFRIKKKTT